MHIGFVGRGITGSAMAMNLVKAGFKVTVQKDLRQALQLADAVGQPPFTTAAVNELFKTALLEGLGECDFAAVSRVIGK